MPRYFFHTANGSREQDKEGMELQDDSAARREAIIYAGAIMVNEPGVLWDSQDFLVEVTDERNLILFTIIASAVNAPAAHDVR